MPWRDVKMPENTVIWVLIGMMFAVDVFALWLALAK
jgi:hypothetical protein